MDTKLKGDIAGQAVILQALRRGWGVLRPVGDRLPYDLVPDISGILIRIQVTSAWPGKTTGNYAVDNRRTRTNGRTMVRAPYETTDVDFAIVYAEEAETCHVVPVGDFLGCGSEIQPAEADRRQRKSRSATYRDAWHLVEQWAACGETHM